jgi:hypothetical protein
MTDLMSWVVPTPRRCMALSRTARYPSGVPSTCDTGAATSLFGIPWSLRLELAHQELVRQPLGAKLVDHLRRFSQMPPDTNRDIGYGLSTRRRIPRSIPPAMT